MDRIERVRQAVDRELDDAYDLLAMRLLFPPLGIKVSISDEISDLYTYPERLESSYRDEWRSLAIRAVFKHGFSDHWRSDEDNLQRYLDHLKGELIPRCIHNNSVLFRRLGEVLQIQSSDNTLVFPSPRRRALMSLIWPDGGA